VNHYTPPHYFLVTILEVSKLIDSNLPQIVKYAIFDVSENPSFDGFDTGNLHDDYESTSEYCRYLEANGSEPMRLVKITLTMELAQ
jgi:hypothetical protein